ncbi:hypothetical protein ACEUZ9_000992 [Paracoccus litorisediminis]
MRIIATAIASLLSFSITTMGLLLVLGAFFSDELRFAIAIMKSGAF